MERFDKQTALQALALCIAALGIGGLVVVSLISVGVF